MIDDNGAIRVGSGGKLADNSTMKQSENDLVQLQLDYAWKWFEFHATQRTTMSNYFLIIVGLLATAYIALLEKGLWYLAAPLGVLGLVTAIAFICLDCRNRELLGFGEDILRHLEKDFLFTEASGSSKEKRLAKLSEACPTKIETQTNADGARRFILVRDAALESARSGMRARIFKHRYWIRGIEAYAGAFFLILGCVALLPVVRNSSDKNLKAETHLLSMDERTLLIRQDQLLSELVKLRATAEQTRSDNEELKREVSCILHTTSSSQTKP